MGGERSGRGRGGHRQRTGNPGRVTKGDMGHYSGLRRCAEQGARSKLPAPSTGHPPERQLRKVTRARRLATTSPPSTVKPGPAHLATPGLLSVSRAAVLPVGTAPQEPGTTAFHLRRWGRRSRPRTAADLCGVTSAYGSASDHARAQSRAKQCCSQRHLRLTETRGPATRQWVSQGTV